MLTTTGMINPHFSLICFFSPPLPIRPVRLRRRVAFFDQSDVMYLVLHPGRLAAQQRQHANQDGSEHEAEGPLEVKEMIEPKSAVLDIPETLVRSNERQRVLKAIPSGIPYMESSQPVECDSKRLDVQFAFE